MSDKVFYSAKLCKLLICCVIGVQILPIAKIPMVAEWLWHWQVGVWSYYVSTGRFESYFVASFKATDCYMVVDAL